VLVGDGAKLEHVGSDQVVLLDERLVFALEVRDALRVCGCPE